jgi:NAD(P)-dependent dehydrogenase (short-subunit alcohol dehydrogenase family)
MDLKLANKVAVVTGAGGQMGYGKGIALNLAREGCYIVIVDMDIEGAQKTAAEVKNLGAKALPVKTDISKQAEVDSMVNKAIAEFGRIDILINNAAIGLPSKPFLELSQDEINRVIGVNLFGTMNTVRAIAPHMIKQKYGKIINFSGGQGLPGDASYGASKAAIISFSNTIAKEFAALGVVVNCFTPGPAETGLSQGRIPHATWENLGKRSPLGRLCSPDDVGRAIAFLVSDMNSYMIGQMVHLNGPVW